MHYANGEEAKLGDLIIRREESDNFGNETIGILVGANAQPGVAKPTCNGNVMAIANRTKSALGWSGWVQLAPQPNSWSVTLSTCLKITFEQLAGVAAATPAGAPSS